MAPTAQKEGFSSSFLSLSLPASLYLSRRPDDNDDEGLDNLLRHQALSRQAHRSFLAAEASATSLWDSPESEKTARDASVTALKERRGKEKSTNEMMHRLPPPPRPHRKASESAEGPPRATRSALSRRRGHPRCGSLQAQTHRSSEREGFRRELRSEKARNEKLRLFVSRDTTERETREKKSKESSADRASPALLWTSAPAAGAGGDL